MFLLVSCQNIKGNLPVKCSVPVFQVDKEDPTADKPQSKLWYQSGCWWAVLPRSTRPSLWQRTNNGWIEHTEISESLAGVPGQSDVWSEGNQVTAVSVGNHSLSVFRLNLLSGAPDFKWGAAVLAELTVPGIQKPIETATIARDRLGTWFVASMIDSKIYLWSSSDNAMTWASPIILANGIYEDDICVVTPLPEGTGIIWSNQSLQGVFMRVHKNENPANEWERTEVVDLGNKTADDHLNTCLAIDGTLWLATKNSIDLLNKPQLVLRIRSVDGKWKNMPYAKIENTLLPTRPVVIATDDNSFVFTGFSNNFQRKSGIIFSVVDTALHSVLKNPRVVIATDTTCNCFVNNITKPRLPFPANVPWIILASDQKGRVYEFDLKKLVR